MSWPNRPPPAGPGTRRRFWWFSGAAAPAFILLCVFAVPCAFAWPQPGALDAPLVFVSDAASGFRSVAGSFIVRIDKQSIRIQDGQFSLGIRYLGSSERATIEPVGQSAALNVFHGGDSNLWRPGLPVWQAVRIKDLYPGIDLVVRTTGGRLKTDYVLAPGADPNLIKVRYEGALRVEVEPGGGLAVEWPGAVWREQPPVAWQAPAEAVEAQFSVDDEGLVRLLVGAYDRGKELIIDPVLTLSTLLGGQGSSQATAVAVDGVGDVYVAGFTDAADFPNVDAIRSRSAGVEAWVVKIRPSESRILWATCLGGSGDDRAFGIALDPAGGVYVTGWTTSPDFPVASPAQAHLSGGRDAFLMKLNTAGSAIVFSTFHGGSNVEAGLAVAASAGSVWIAGETASADLPLALAPKSVLGGPQDGFLARFTDTGARVSSTYLGGSGEELIRALALDASGRPYVAGSSDSLDLGLPVGVLQRTPAGGRDGFILRFSAMGDALETGTMLGGTAGSASTIETISAIAIDSGGGAVVAGFTPSSDFPVVSAWRAAKAGDVDGFLARLAPDFAAITWSTYVGGINRDTLDGLALDSSGRIYVAGKTMSADFPLASPLQASKSANLDAVLMRFPASGGAPDFSTFLGGTGGDGAMSVSLSLSSVAWVAGVAGAVNFPQVNPLVTLPQDSIHAFLSGVAFATASAPAIHSLTPSTGVGAAQSFTLRITDAAGGRFISSVHVLVNSAQTGLRPCFVSYDGSQNVLSLNGDPGTAWSAGSPGAAATLSNRQCELNLAGSVAVATGAFLDLTLQIAFKSAMSGEKKLYVIAANGSGLSTGWIQAGNWTVTVSANQPPAPTVISPASGGGTRQLFTIQFTDPDGASDLDMGEFTVGHSPSAPASCALVFHRTQNTIALLDDDGASWTEAVPGASAMLSNDQCLLRLATSASNTNAGTWSVTLDLEFAAGWSGVKGLFLRATDGSGGVSGWTAAGTYRVGGMSGGSPVLSAVSPSGVSGGGGLFEIAYWDPDGSADIDSVTVLFNGAHTAANGCLILADRRYGSIYLASDSGASWSGGKAGQALQLANSQCTVNLQASTYAYAGSTLKVRIWVGFKASFLGTKTIWSHATDQSGRASPPMAWTGSYIVTSAMAYSAGDENGRRDLPRNWAATLHATKRQNPIALNFEGSGVKSYSIWLPRKIADQPS